MSNTSHESSDWTTYLHFHDQQAAHPERFAALMAHPAYPRASAYNPVWVHHNLMGPNSLWLLDDLTGCVDLSGCTRVLDLGCGAALTSIFLARELGVEVWAGDMWIEPSANWERIQEASLAGRVHPLELEAYRLPFATGFFDAVVSVDSYHYFGTDVRYLSYLAQFVRPGGVIAVVVPGNAADPDNAPTDVGGSWFARHGADWFTFRSAAWWGRHWGRTRGVEVEQAEVVPDGWGLWWRHEEAKAAWSGGDPGAEGDGAILQSSQGATLGFSRVVARRTADVPLVFGPGRYQTRLA
jgi:SAM-dependent methyltransferase